MNSVATTCYLKASPDTILGHLAISHGERPLLAGKQPEELRAFITRQLAERAPYYELAHHTVSVDVLDSFEKIAICVAYEIDGRITKEFPASIAELQAVKPVLEWLPGWQCETSGATCWNDLPENARNYLKRMAELVDSSIAVVSVGPRRDQTFMV